MRIFNVLYEFTESRQNSSHSLDRSNNLAMVMKYIIL